MHDGITLAVLGMGFVVFSLAGLALIIAFMSKIIKVINHGVDKNQRSDTVENVNFLSTDKVAAIIAAIESYDLGEDFYFPRVFHREENWSITGRYKSWAGKTRRS